MSQSFTEIPQELTKYFWDTDIATLELPQNSRYVAERILEYGDVSAWQWLMREMPQAEVIDTIKYSRNISLKTANFFQRYFAIPKVEVACLQIVSRGKPLRMWPY